MREGRVEVLATVWPGYEICWAYDGTEELAGYVGARLRPASWDRQPTLKLARGRSHLCHPISVVDADGQLRFWPLWWHLSKAWHGPALLDKLPGPGIRRIRLGKIPEGGAHIDVRRKTLGAWQTADTFESFEDSPAGHIAKIAGLLAPVAPGFAVSSDALGDCGVRPTKAEWSRFVSACDRVRSVDAESA